MVWDGEEERKEGGGDVVMMRAGGGVEKMEKERQRIGGEVLLG